MLRNVTLLGVFAIAIDAIADALSRYYLTEFRQRAIGTNFFYGTFFITVTGCFIIAWFYTLKIKNLSPEICLMAATVLCAAYTTFLNYGLEASTQIGKGNATVALLSWIGSVVVGMVAVELGVTLGSLNSKSSSVNI